MSGVMFKTLEMQQQEAKQQPCMG